MNLWLNSDKDAARPPRKMKMGKLFISVLCIICNIVTLTVTKQSHPITTLINAKWNVTPVTLEIAEYLYDENPNLFWDYIDALISLDKPIEQLDNDAQRYKQAVKIAEGLLSETQVPLLKLSLSLHNLSPRVQAHLQIASEVLKKHIDCDEDIFVNIGDNIVCGLSGLADEIKKANDPMPAEVFDFDHIFPGSLDNSFPVILYGQIGTENFAKAHKMIKKAAETGKYKYILRHYLKSATNKRLRLSGYGVELHLKSTEYKSQDDAPKPDDTGTFDHNELETEVDGFDFLKLKSRFPHLIHSLDQFRNKLLEKSEDIEPLKAWEFQELGLQAAERIASIQGEESLQILQIISQNFPTQAKSLLHTTVSDSFKKEMKYNIDVLGRNLNLQPPDAALFVNGLFFDADTLDVNTLLETLRTEAEVLDGLHKIGLKGLAASPLLALDLTSTSKEFAIDIRDSAISWINDIEKDTEYARWPSSVMDLLRPTFPGMLRNIRKNLFNLILVVDPVKPDARPLIKLAESFVVHSAPLRLGIVLDTRQQNDDNAEDYRGIVCAFNYLSSNIGYRTGLSFLTDLYATVKSSKDVTFSDIKKQFRVSHPKIGSDKVDSIFGEDSSFDYGTQVAVDFLDRIGTKESPQALLNGVPLPSTTLSADEFEEAVLTEIIQQTPIIQKAVYRGDLSDSDDMIDYLMSQPHVMPRLNQRILSNDDPDYLSMTGKPHDVENVNLLSQLTNRDKIATLRKNLKYFTSKHKMEKIIGNSVYFQTIWIIGDLNQNSGKTILLNALNYMKLNGGIRVAFIPNADGVGSVAKEKNLNQLVWAASQALDGTEATNTVLKWLEQTNDNYDIPKNVRDLLSSTELHMKLLRVYCQTVHSFKSSDNVIISNGRIYGPLEQNETFSTDDFDLMERFSNHHYGDKIRKAFQEIEKMSQDDLEIDSDTMFQLISILVTRTQSKNRFTIPTELLEDHTVVKLLPKADYLPHFEIVGVLDPASRGAQKLAPILIMLRSVTNCHMRVFLCAVDKHSDMPVKNFYRFVIEPELQFSAKGELEAGPLAKFAGIPPSPLLTQNLQVPENWLVEIVRSVYDLDNIKLQDINGPVHSEYELEHLLLEGHCFDTTTGAPPRGLQITLGTKDNPVMVDTIVMANLGYFQLKANPGSWILRLRHGKSADIYDISSAEGPNTVHSSEETRVIINSLRSHVLKLRVTKKPGQANADLLGVEETPSGIWDSITSSFGGGSGDDKSETINIFSVASGHLYERLLRIMMLSLLKHTKSPVKFWFLKNYLSPQFIEFMPHMAKEYDFQYELVQYKWPRWLHQQTEKQRTIWGYKILFLDVLFPLDVKKIIFVDADAIVRADIKELNTLDLGGAPYAYTPFCDSKREMEGFRFWKQGYWKNHLQGRKYHISALYVVDLKKFRKIAAGDRLRGQYQALSQDPNSLSNLDQDLPNNMIHQVAIKSLPQEWLYCQTWCSDETLQYAKVIDLCNNPQTKEAKLTAAQRIVPEWKPYDTEIKNLMNRIEAGEIEHEDLAEIRETDTKINKDEHTEL